MVAMIPTGYGFGYSQTRLTQHSQGIRGGDVICLDKTDVCCKDKKDACFCDRTDVLCCKNMSVLSQHTMLMSQKSQQSQCRCLRSLNCGNVTMFKSQIGGLALDRRKWSEMVPEWSPGHENRPPGMPRPFSPLGPVSRPKTRQKG